MNEVEIWFNYLTGNMVFVDGRYLLKTRKQLESYLNYACEKEQEAPDAYRKTMVKLNSNHHHIFHLDKREKCFFTTSGNEMVCIPLTEEQYNAAVTYPIYKQL